MGTENVLKILDLIKDLFIDACIDTLEIVPFLLVTYIILEFIEHKTSSASQKIIKEKQVIGPLLGAFLGVIPQCGFSSAASTFYAGRVITVGTLFAVYLSTSDEMIPIFIAGGIPGQEMALIILVKVIIAIVVGFSIDIAVKNIYKKKNIKQSKDFKIHNLCQMDNCSCSGQCKACEHNPTSVYDAHDLNGQSDSHGHIHNHPKSKILKPAIMHTLQITLFIFLITFALNLILEAIGGEEVLSAFLQNNKYSSIIGAALVGLIPNCAASVVIAKLYVDGVLTIGALIAGLLTSAGIGLIVLFKTNRPTKHNVYIVIILFVISVVFGLIISLVGF